MLFSFFNYVIIEITDPTMKQILIDYKAAVKLFESYDQIALVIMVGLAIILHFARKL